MSKEVYRSLQKFTEVLKENWMLIVEMDTLFWS